mgnify:CR=1 FL=1
MKKRNRQPRSREALNSELIRRPIRRCWPLFLLPTALAFCIGFLYPFLLGLYRSFCEFTSPVDYHWAGFSNYFRAFADEGFRRAFGFTAAYAVVSILIINICAFALAYALTQKLRGSNIFRTVFFLPNLIGGIVLGYIWQILLNGILTNLGKPLLSLDARYGFWGLIILMCWQQIGYMMIIYIAGLQNVPGDLLEAAAIDGATGTQALFKVKLPMVMPSITICVFLTLTNSFKLFDQNLALTNGAPSNTSEMLALNIYRTFYGRAGFEGVGQAKAVMFFILVALIAIIQNKLTTSKEVQA